MVGRCSVTVLLLFSCTVRISNARLRNEENTKDLAHDKLIQSPTGELLVNMQKYSKFYSKPLVWDMYVSARVYKQTVQLKPRSSHI